MLATFVIGLREGLEAALIVGIVAAFLRQRGGGHALRLVWIGVLSALVICLAIGVILQVVSANLPQRQQEGLETVIGAVAVAMVTYMVVWMRRHSRDLKGQLEGVAGSALAQNSARALVAMAFLAVLREGLETAVFLLAAFQASGNGLTAGLGALLGILVAAALGYGIYRGGVKINLSRFFRATGIVLVVVAAGLVMTAFHTAHEAGWINSGQDQLFDISWLVRPGSVQASLITGVLGIQSKPTVIEVIAWLVYLGPVLVFIAWPPGRRVPWRPIAWAASWLAVACAAGAVAFAVAAPAKPDPAAAGVWTSAVSGTTTTRVSGQGFSAARQQPVAATIVWSASGASKTGTAQRAGIAVDVLARDSSQAVTGDPTLAKQVTLEGLRQLDGGRLPIGLLPSSVNGPIAISYQQQLTDTYWRDPKTGVLLDASRQTVVVASARVGSAPFVLGEVRTTDVQATAAAQAAAAKDNRELRATAQRAESWGSDYPTLLGIGAAAMAGLAIGASLMLRRRTANEGERGGTLDAEAADKDVEVEVTDDAPTISGRVPVR